MPAATSRRLLKIALTPWKKYGNAEQLDANCGFIQTEKETARNVNHIESWLVWRPFIGTGWPVMCVAAVVSDLQAPLESCTVTSL